MRIVMSRDYGALYFLAICPEMGEGDRVGVIAWTCRLVEFRYRAYLGRSERKQIKLSSHSEAHLKLIEK